MQRIFYLLLFLVLPCSFLFSQGREYERIKNFHADISVLPDASVNITETITVYADLDRIKRGIFRSLPVLYRDSYGNRFKARYRILSVMKNGDTEPYHIKNENGYRVVYIGDKDVFLVPGEYTYTINYTADRMVGFYEAYDEIYWNVTGNQWDFAIMKASAVVRLPAGATVFSGIAYTGIQGSREKEYTYQATRDGRHVFSSTDVLQPREGMTIALGFNKGAVLAPTGSTKFRYFMEDNLGAVIAFGLLILMTLWFIYAWMKVGRDPAKGAIAVLYYPPAGFSPASLRYVLRMGFDLKCFSSNVIMLAVKGFLSISQSGKTFTLKKNAFMKEPLTTDEKTLGDKLFTSSELLILSNTNHSRISGAQNGLKSALKKLHSGKHFNTNTAWYLPCLLLSALSLAALIITADEPGPAAGISLWMLLWGLGSWAIFSAMMKKIRSKSSFTGRLFMSFLTLLLMLPMAGSLAGGILLLGAYLTPLSFIIIFLTGCFNAIYYKLLKAPTREGRALMDQTEGFRQYLSVAEKDELELKNPPDKTVELFEKYLPYAIALGVENRWGEKFSSILDAAAQAGTYSPAWYSGTALSAFTAASFTNSLGSSFSSALGSAAVAPGSSSGSGGGGFSGGGGGGGGGGGW
jgi:uncharacterized membrane protein YgcG